MTLTQSAGILAFYGIVWHFGIFAKKSNKKSIPIFPIFRLFPTFRLADSTALVSTEGLILFRFRKALDNSLKGEKSAATR